MEECSLPALCEGPSGPASVSLKATIIVRDGMVLCGILSELVGTLNVVVLLIDFDSAIWFVYVCLSLMSWLSILLEQET